MIENKQSKITDELAEFKILDHTSLPPRSQPPLGKRATAI